MAWRMSDAPCMKCFEPWPCQHVNPVDERPAEPLDPADLVVRPWRAGAAQDGIQGAPDAAPATILRDPRARASRAAQRSRVVGFFEERLGLPLWEPQKTILSETMASPSRVNVWRFGRRASKSTMAAGLAVYALTADIEAHRPYVRRGEPVAAAFVSNSREQAGESLRVVREFLDRPAMRPLVVRQREHEIELSTGGRLLVLPASARTIRGRALAFVALDELASAVESDGGLMSPQAASELVDALLPSTMQFPAGRMVITSTPRFAAGELYRWSQAGADPMRPEVTEWHRASHEMNPTLTPQALEAMRAHDPGSWNREVLALFDAGGGAVFDPEALRAAMRPSGVLPPEHGVSYTGSLDAAGATGDAWALSIVHRDRSGVVVVDGTWAWQGHKGRPLDYATTLDHIASIVIPYRAPVRIDQWASMQIASGLRERNVTPRVVPWGVDNKAEAVRVARQLLYGSNLSLPGNDPALLAELSMLEARPLPGGKTRVAGPPGSHDDRAMSFLGAVAEVEQRYTGRIASTGWSPWD